MTRLPAPASHRFNLSLSTLKLAAWVWGLSRGNNNAFNRVGSLDVSRADLIIASIVEREAKFDEQRAQIAGVYRNRIENNMKLESCPTVNYAYDSKQVASLTAEEAKTYDYWQNISFSLYKTTISDYNTYLNSGLPPNPISNPGIMSIDAAVNYAKHDYLYFLHDSEGNIYLAETAAGHENNKAKHLNWKKSCFFA